MSRHYQEHDRDSGVFRRRRSHSPDAYGSHGLPFHRPRSVPPFSDTGGRGPLMTPAGGGPTLSRGRSRGRDYSRSRSRSRGSSRSKSRSRFRDPVIMARDAVGDTFTTSDSGLGVGILGAIVGGLAARHITEVTADPRQRGGHGHGHGRHCSNSYGSRLLLSTAVGAAVGGLGANALERRLEDLRERERRESKEDDRGRSRRGREGGFYHDRRYPSHHHHRYDGRDDGCDHVYDGEHQYFRRPQSDGALYRHPNNRQLEY